MWKGAWPLRVTSNWVATQSRVPRPRSHPCWEGVTHPPRAAPPKLYWSLRLFRATAGSRSPPPNPAGHSPVSPTLAHLGPSPRSPWSRTPPSPGSGPERPTPPRPAAPSRHLQFLPTRASFAHRTSGPFSAGRRAPSAPAPSPSSLSDLGLSPHQSSCLSPNSRLPPPPFILPGPGSWPRQQSPVPPQPRRAPPLSPSPTPPLPIPQPVSVPAACQLFLAAELLIHAAPAECARSLPRGRRGRGPSCPGCWGSGARAVGPAHADLSSHLPPGSCRAGATEGMSARVSLGGVAEVTLPGGMWCRAVTGLSWRPGVSSQARRVGQQDQVPGRGARGGGGLRSLVPARGRGPQPAVRRLLAYSSWNSLP